MENIPFATTFWSPYPEVATIGGELISAEELIGKEFIVITEKDKDTYDHVELGVVYIIEFDGGLVCEALAEEVELHTQTVYKRTYKGGMLE